MRIFSRSQENCGIPHSHNQAREPNNRIWGKSLHSTSPVVIAFASEYLHQSFGRSVPERSRAACVALQWVSYWPLCCLCSASGVVDALIRTDAYLYLLFLACGLGESSLEVYLSPASVIPIWIQVIYVVCVDRPKTSFSSTLVDVSAIGPWVSGKTEIAVLALPTSQGNTKEQIRKWEKGYNSVVSRIKVWCSMN